MLCQAAFNFFSEYLSETTGNYLEIGVFNGESIRELARKYANKRIYAVDPFIEDGYTSWITKTDIRRPLNMQRENTLNNISGIPNIVLSQCTSVDFFQKLTSSQIREMDVSAVFIDGDHHEDHVVNDLELAMRLIGPTAGVVFLDDVDVISRCLFRPFLKFRSRITRFDEDRSANTITLYIN